MNAKADSSINKTNLIKWSAVTVIFAAALLLNYHFSSIALAIRMIFWIIIFAGMLGLLAWTTQGRMAIEFLGESRMELRKVVWPTRQETVQTTGIIVAMVAACGLLMWGFDSLLMYIIGLLAGQRG